VCRRPSPMRTRERLYGEFGAAYKMSRHSTQLKPVTRELKPTNATADYTNELGRTEYIPENSSRRIVKAESSRVDVLSEPVRSPE